MVPQASEKCGLQSPDHPHIGCCTSNSLNSEHVLDTIFMQSVAFCTEV